MSLATTGAGRSKGQKAAIPTLTLTATTTAPGETVTIDRMTPAAGKTLTIAWGDGNSTVVAAGDETAKSNVYAAAGTYSVTVTPATDIVQIDLHNSKLSGFQSSQLATSAITLFYCYSLGAAVASVIDSQHMASWTPSRWYLFSMPVGTYNIDSADMAAWTPSDWRLFSMPAGTYRIDSADMATWTPSTWVLSMPAGGTYSIDSEHMASWTPGTWQLYSMSAGGTYSIDSEHMAAWTPSGWYLYSMPAGTYRIDSADMATWTPSYWHLYSMPAGTYAIDSADMAAWTPSSWYLYSMPAGTTFTLDAAHFAGFTRCGVFRADANGWSAAQVNAVLWGLYQATLNRTVTGGTIQMDGTNAAPSGTFQAAASCPVTAATPGKEVAHELLNDGCNAIAEGETWATVAVTA